MAVSLRVRGLAAAAAIVAAAMVAGLGLPGTGDPADGGAGAAAGTAGVSAGAGLQRVVVMGEPGRRTEAERAALALGGRITRRLDVVNGFAAELPASAVAPLARVPGVVSVTPDRKVRPAGSASSAMTPTTSPSGAASAGVKAAASGKTGTVTVDTGDLSAVTQLTGARTAWAAGATGRGVDIAVIDTGVAPVEGLDGTGKMLVGPDLSFDAPGAPAPGLDAHGHGTFMAGIIAGRDAGTSPSSPSGFMGVAPDARVVNVKVGAYDGATDVSQVIAALDWVTQHAHDPGLNIRVINLSFGTDSRQDYRVDPLAQAAEQAWKHGIVVVAAAGNDGRATQDLADPAADPHLLAVGGDDPAGTLDPADDSVPAFAQHGTNARPVDVIAPAAHLLSLRVPGSYVDTLATNAGQVGTRFQRGSGTSEAAAVVSGVVALLVQKYPAATPDAIKALIMDTAAPVLRGSGRESAPGQMLYSGHGLVDAAAALAAGPATGTSARTRAASTSTGAGTLDGARGSSTVSVDGVPLTGQQDIFGHAFDSAAMARLQARAASWSGGVWNGNRWTGDGWTDGGWARTDWAGTNWAGSHWRSSVWSSMTWAGSHWRGSGWAGSHWRGEVWSTAGWE